MINVEEYTTLNDLFENYEGDYICEEIYVNIIGVEEF